MNDQSRETPEVPATGGKVGTNQVCAALKTVQDPEIGLDIVSLGMIYGVEISETGHRVEVRMTLTTPRCPLAPFIVEQVKRALLKLPGVKEAEVRLVWEPEWNPKMMAAEEVKRRFGMS